MSRAMNLMIQILKKNHVPFLSFSDPTDISDGEIEISKDFFLQVGPDYCGLYKKLPDGNVEFWPEPGSTQNLLDQIREEIASMANKIL